MDALVCPACGSNEIANSRCVKCGALLSDARPQSMPTKPISYVAPASFVKKTAASAEPRTWKPPSVAEIRSIQESRERSKRKNQIVVTITFFILAVIGFEIYQFFLRQASEYSGYYWNNHQYFALNFPEKGWSHYRERQLRSLDLKDPVDGFYRGRNPNDPEILMAVWTEFNSNGYRERFDDQTAETLKRRIEEEIVGRMSMSGLQCQITESKNVDIGGNDGFLIRADLKKGSQNLKTMIYCAYNQHFAYTIQFVGDENKMQEQSNDIESLMGSFEFRTSMI